MHLLCDESVNQMCDATVEPLHDNCSTHLLWLPWVSSLCCQAGWLACVYTLLADTVPATSSRRQHGDATHRESVSCQTVRRCFLLEGERERQKKERLFLRLKRSERARSTDGRGCASVDPLDVLRKCQASYELMWWMFVFSVRKTVKYLQRGIKRLVSVRSNCFMWFLLICRPGGELWISQPPFDFMALISYTWAEQFSFSSWLWLVFLVFDLNALQVPTTPDRAATQMFAQQ